MTLGDICKIIEISLMVKSFTLRTMIDLVIESVLATHLKRLTFSMLFNN